MGKECHSWEAALGTIDVGVSGKKIGTTTVKSLTVPSGMNHLYAYSPVHVTDFTALGSDVGFAILGGNAITTPAELPLGGSGAELVIASCAPTNPRWFKDLGIPVIPGNKLDVTFVSHGEDTGLPQAAMSLMFTNKAPVNGWHEYRGREVQLTVIDVAGELPFQGLGTGATLDFDVPGDIIGDGKGALDRVFAVGSTDGSSVGAGYAALKLGGNGILKDQELVIFAAGGTNVDEPVGNFAVTDFDELEWDLVKNNTIEATGIMGGVDIGTVSLGIALGFKIPKRN